jgi:hypothetical protein
VRTEDRDEGPARQHSCDIGRADVQAPVRITGGLLAIDDTSRGDRILEEPIEPNQSVDEIGARLCCRPGARNGRLSAGLRGRQLGLSGISH